MGWRHDDPREALYARDCAHIVVGGALGYTAATTFTGTYTVGRRGYWDVRTGDGWPDVEADEPWPDGWCWTHAPKEPGEGA